MSSRPNSIVRSPLKKALRFFLYTIVVLGLLAVLFISPINRTPIQDQPFYQSMMKQLDTLHLISNPALSKVKVGWSKFNITPSYLMPMAGYTPKDKFESVHDSAYCRVLAIDNGASMNFIVSIDLMLFPPIIKEKISKKLKSLGRNYFLYFSATHTHSSLGGWDPSLVGRFTLGSYHEEWVDQTVNSLLENLEIAKAKSIPSSISYWEADAHEFVENRLGVTSATDGKLRGIKIIRQDSSKAIAVVFSGHPTTIDLLSRVISGDYPSALINRLEKKGFDFGLFMAGMVGSHRLIGFDGEQYQKLDTIARTLGDRIESSVIQNTSDSVSISSAHIPISYGSSQLRIEKNWKVRDWAFRAFIEPLQGEFTYLEIGNTILIGTPCDFSGEIFVNEELEKLAASHEKKLIITSFNGNYNGYITSDQHYDQVNEEEVMALNWVGPYFGKYYSDALKKIISH